VRARKKISKRHASKTDKPVGSTGATGGDFHISVDLRGGETVTSGGHEEKMCWGQSDSGIEEREHRVRNEEKDGEKRMLN